METTRLLLWAARREKQGVLNTESIKRFSCTDFRTIDNLWRQYSNGRFGFSLQMRIWQKITPQDPEEFASKIGWINYDKSWVKYNDLTFDLRAPIGHLPTGGAFMPSGNLKGNWFSILSNQCF
ncbi:GUN4 domain-containing protein [Nostoc sp.]